MSDTIADACLATWSKLEAGSAFGFLKDPFFTILAGIVLVRGEDIECISLGSGSKCLAQSQLSSLGGQAVHDSHAEVLARRGAISWLFSEILKMRTVPGFQSKWLEQGDPNAAAGKYRLKGGTQAHMYVSTLPCGDASTFVLASEQDSAMAALKDACPPPPLSPGIPIRGRNNYSAFGVLRTKPGRADSSPSASMSCSDKIASWTYMGLQGAILSHFLEPVYLRQIVVGDTMTALRPRLEIECERAFSLRTSPEVPPSGMYSFHAPAISFTGIKFPHSKGDTMCPESVVWNSNTQKVEIIINGYIRGHTSKSRIPKRLTISRNSLFATFLELDPTIGENCKTYQEAKDAALEYRAAKESLRSPGAPLWGWVVSPEDRASTR